MRNKIVYRRTATNLARPTMQTKVSGRWVRLRHDAKAIKPKRLFQSSHEIGWFESQNV